jgi:hypothetical protein
MTNVEAQENKVLHEIVFGSCLDRTEQSMLDKTLDVPMDLFLFLFLGDNIYRSVSCTPWHGYQI